jgi:large subunit ribosomal protein L21
MTFAVIKTGGKQYKVAANDVVKIEKIAGEPGDVVTFDQVLLVGEGDAVTVGAPLVEGALVAGQFIATEKERTVIILKKERRQHYDRRNGHRQRLSTVRITEILTGGAKPTTKVDEIAKARHEKRLAALVAQNGAAVTEAPAAAEKPVAAKKPAARKAAAEAPAAGFTDDITLIGGVGPALAKKLAAAGITSLTQVAAWTEADVARYDEELDFKGRIARDEWVDQARELVAGKPPRAKADQEAAAARKPAAKKAAKADDKE